MSDIYFVIDRMRGKFQTLRENTENPMRKHCLGLLYDSLVWSEFKLRALPGPSLVEFIELATWTVKTDEPDEEHFRKLRKRLPQLGFLITPAN